MNRQRMINQLKRHEGFRGQPYQDSVGKTTIGYGRNLDDNPLSEEEATVLLNNDLDAVLREVPDVVENWESLNGARQAVLVNMGYNMGVPTLRYFQKMIAAIEQEDYEKAAEEMADSRWYRQVGRRAVELCEQMQTGAYI